MTDDNIFRLFLIALFAAFLPFGLYHRYQAHTGEKIDRWQEGVFILFGLRLTAALAFAGGFAWLLNPAWMAWSHLAIPASLRWVGVACVAFACLLFLWTVRFLGKNLTDTVVTRQQHSLVTTGPYRWVRHPFYVAFILGFMGVSVAMANWFILLTGSILWFAFLLPRTRIEEAKLIERFGDEYRTYMRRVGRFFPRRLPSRSET